MKQDKAGLDTLYKLIVLYMLCRADEPLTKVQVCDFVQGKNLTDYLTLQTTFSELIENNMLESTASGKRTYLNVTPEGRQTLSFFEKRITADTSWVHRKTGNCKDLSVVFESEFCGY